MFIYAPRLQEMYPENTFPFYLDPIYTNFTEKCTKQGIPVHTTISIPESTPLTYPD